jgi:ribosome-binding protein aMBF1 (putative translation factor)
MWYKVSSVFNSVSSQKRTQMDPKKLGKKVKLARVEPDLSQTQFAQRINSKQENISCYEAGASLP